MLVKHPKPQYRKWLKKGALIVFVVEAAGFAVSYYGWSKINTDRESRRYLKDNYPSLLEVYYKTGELFDSNSRLRQLDQTYWNAESKTQDYPGVGEDEKQRYNKSQQFVNVLEAASRSDKPFYRLSKDEIDNIIKK